MDRYPRVPDLELEPIKTAAEGRAERGVTNESLVERLQDNSLPVIEKSVLRKNSYTRHTIINLFNRYVDEAKELGLKIRINGVQVHNWQEAIAPERGQWESKRIEKFFRYYLEETEPQDPKHETIHISTFKSFTRAFRTLYKASREGVGFSKGDIIRLDDLEKKLSIEFKLRCELYRWHQISRKTVMLLASRPPDYPCDSNPLVLLRRAMILAIVSTTGANWESIIGTKQGLPWDTAEDIELRSGLRFSDLHFWIRRGETDGLNEVICYMSPRSGETELPDVVSLPLPETSQLRTSAGILALLAAKLAGVIEPSLQEILSPEYLGGAMIKRVSINEEQKMKVLFPTRADPYISVNYKAMNRTLGRGCYRDDRVFDVRSLNVRYMVVPKVSMIETGTIRLHLHPHNPRVLARTEPIWRETCEGKDTVSRIFDYDSSFFPESNRFFFWPDAGSPRSVISYVMGQPEMYRRKEQQMRMLAEVAAKYGILEEAPAPFQREYKRLGSDYAKRLLQLVELRIKEVKSGKSTSAQTQRAAIESDFDRSPAEGSAIDIRELVSTICDELADDEQEIEVAERKAMTPQEVRWRELMLGPVSGAIELYDLLKGWDSDATDGVAMAEEFTDYEDEAK